KRAEDRAADNEVHRQHTEAPVRRDVSRDASRRAAAGQEPDRQREQQVAACDGRDDLPAFHAPLARLSWSRITALVVGREWVSYKVWSSVRVRVSAPAPIPLLHLITLPLPLQLPVRRHQCSAFEVPRSAVRAFPDALPKNPSSWLRSAAR